LDIINAIAFKKVDERLLNLLHKKSNISNSSNIITHEQLANELGTFRVVVSRLTETAKKKERNLEIKFSFYFSYVKKVAVRNSGISIFAFKLKEVKMEIFGYIASVLIGVSLGLIGGGGSILTVPVLVYLFWDRCITGYRIFAFCGNQAVWPVPWR
jgi:uncharacterized membrane protein